MQVMGRYSGFRSSLGKGPEIEMYGMGSENRELESNVHKEKRGKAGDRDGTQI